MSEVPSALSADPGDARADSLGHERRTTGNAIQARPDVRVHVCQTRAEAQDEEGARPNSSVARCHADPAVDHRMAERRLVYGDGADEGIIVGSSAGAGDRNLGVDRFAVLRREWMFRSEGVIPLNVRHIGGEAVLATLAD